MIRGARIAGALGAAGGLPPPLAQEVAYDRGLYAGAQGDLAVALSSYASYCAGARSLGDARGLTTGLRTRAYTLRLVARRGLWEAVHLVDSATWTRPGR